jgi:hypothetical protein
MHAQKRLLPTKTSKKSINYTWLLHYTPESNRQLSEWTERDKPNPKREKTQWSGYSISILGCRGIIFIDYLENGQTINSEYCIALLERLNDEIKKKRPIINSKSAVSSNQSKRRQNCMN